MENVTITFNTLLQLFGAVAVVGGGLKIIISMFNPFRELKAEVNNIKGFLEDEKKRLKDGDKKMDYLDKRMDKMDEALSVLGLSMSEMINHMLTGNDEEALREQQRKLNEYFYKGKEN